VRGGKSVEIPFPDGRRVGFKIYRRYLREGISFASVIKDAGDDPDVTNGAEIVASVRIIEHSQGEIVIKGGEGVGVVTRPGLPVPIGEPAINPVPLKMIKAAVHEAISEFGKAVSLEVIISVPEGRELAKKTLNARLGIAGGISILGTTGIVTPLSSEAWTATISSALNVAEAMGFEDVVLSSGRVSEKAAMRKFSLPEPACIMMGDYVEHSFLEAGKHRFGRIRLACQWAKMLKIAMGTPDTHVRAGAIEPERATAFLSGLGIGLPDRKFNTVREMFEHVSTGNDMLNILKKASQYGSRLSGLAVSAHLVSYEGDIIADYE
jgi:cobalt-precorrin-5B (C1)-methyltransferase